MANLSAGQRRDGRAVWAGMLHIPLHNGQLRQQSRGEQHPHKGYSYAAQSSSCPSGALTKAHAVTTAGSNTYCYDANGNMERRVIGGSTYNITHDAENMLVSVSGAATATFYYDSDGNRVKGTVNGVTTTYIGNWFEWTGSISTMKKYYYAGATRVAMRTGSSTLNFLLGDHLDSTAITASSGGALSVNIHT